MSYIYSKIGKSDFIQAFALMGKKDNFTNDASAALYEYLEQLADDGGEPIELDVIALCCEFSEYESLEEFNNNHNETCASWDDVSNLTTVIKVSDDGAIVADL